MWGTKVADLLTDSPERSLRCLEEEEHTTRMPGGSKMFKVNLVFVCVINFQKNAHFHIYKMHICTFIHLHRYLDSQYVTADDSVLSFLNLTEVFPFLDIFKKVSCKAF